jgi:hypothetical protein
MSVSLYGSGQTVIQVVNSVLTSSFSTTSTSYVNTGLSASITPQSTTSKILVLVSLNGLGQSAGYIGVFNLLRNGSTVVNNTGGGETQTFAGWVGAGGINNNRMMDSATISYLDSPSSTSSLTYSVQMRQDAGGTGTLNSWQINSDAGAVSTITLMEISGN